MLGGLMQLCYLRLWYNTERAHDLVLNGMVPPLLIKIQRNTGSDIFVDTFRLGYNKY